MNQDSRTSVRSSSTSTDTVEATLRRSLNALARQAIKPTYRFDGTNDPIISLNHEGHLVTTVVSPTGGGAPADFLQVYRRLYNTNTLPRDTLLGVLEEHFDVLCELAGELNTHWTGWGPVSQGSITAEGLSLLDFLKCTLNDKVRTPMQPTPEETLFVIELADHLSRGRTFEDALRQLGAETYFGEYRPAPWRGGAYWFRPYFRGVDILVKNFDLE